MNGHASPSPRVGSHDFGVVGIGSSGSSGSTRSRGYRRFLLYCSTLCIVLYLALRRPRRARVKYSGLECDPFHEPGQLILNLSTPLYTEWRTYDTARCSPIQDVLPSLWRLARGAKSPIPSHTPAGLSPFQLDMETKGSKAAAPAKMRGKKAADPVAFLDKRRRHPPTALLIGDSVDRNALVHFCQLFQAPVSISRYDDINVHPPPHDTPDLTKNHGPPFEGWDQRGLPHLCQIPFANGKGTALRLMNVFHYGMDELDEFDTPQRSDWHKPGKFEDRLEQLFLPYVNQFGGVDKVDLVVLQSGIWDLALFGTQDGRAGQALEEPLTKDHMLWWTERMSTVIRLVQATFPQSRVVLRLMHRTDDQTTAYLTNWRVHQLRHLAMFLAKREGVPIFDFGHPIEGYQMFQTRVHPELYTGGAIYASGLLYHMREALKNRGWL